MSNRSRLVLDIVLFLAFLVAFSPGVTGISVHEWLSLAIALPTLVHLVVNWDWVVRVTGTLLGKIRAASRVNLAVDAALFIATVTVMLSGALVSRAIAGALGLALAPDAIWYAVHSLSAWLVIMLLGTHFALHWSWAWRVARTWVARPTAEVAA